MEFKLIEDQGTMKLYENEFYKLYITNDIRIQLHSKTKFVPDAQSQVHPLEFNISTTSYGSLSTDKIKELIKGYEIALESIEKVKELVSK